MQSASKNRNSILINGGGIAGLTAALCLSRKGIQVEVHEKAEGFETIGAGIQISPNAYRVMDQLGLGSLLRSAANAPDAIQVTDAKTGKSLCQIPLGYLATKRYGAPYLVIHRADLQEILFEACQNATNIKMFFASQVTDFTTHSNGITALVLQNGKTYERICKALVLADGVHSKLRTLVPNIAEPEFQSKIAWRALIPEKDVPTGFNLVNTSLWFGENAHAVTYPVKGARFLNVVGITHGSQDTKLNLVDRGELAEHFSPWDEKFKALFDTRATWTGWPLYHTKAVNKLVGHHVAIIGDAAHAALPFAAQGAAMAIEDAAVLAYCFHKNTTTQSALEAFEKQRIPRLNRILKTAHKNGQIYHMSGIKALARNIGMSLVPKPKLLHRQDWIFDWKPKS